MENELNRQYLDAQFSQALTETFRTVLGGTGYAALLAASGIPPLIDGNEMPLEQAAGLLEGLKQVYGTRGSLALTPRITQQFIDRVLKGQGIFLAFNTEEFVSLEPDSRRMVALSAFVKSLQAHSDLSLSLSKDESYYLVSSPAGGEGILASLVAPLLEAYMHWALPDAETMVSVIGNTHEPQLQLSQG